MHDRTCFSFTSSGLKIFVVVMLILCALAFPLSVCAVSESPTTKWTETYGSGDGEWAYSLIQTADRGYAIAGAAATYSWPERGYINYTFLLIKTDEEGKMQWNKTYGNEDEHDELAYSIVQTEDEGYVIAGVKLYSSVVDGEYRVRGDFWLVKTDSEGVMQWNRTYGGAENEQLNQVILTSDGGYALIGYREASVFPYYADAWLVKTDADGNMQWNRTYGDEDFDWGSCVLETDEGYAICGWTYSFGSGDFWLIKTDLLGNVRWNRTYGGQEQEWANCVVKSKDGGYLLAGRTESFGAGGGDAWLVKTDSSGNMQWNKTYGDADREYVQSVVQTRDGGYVFVGSINSVTSGDADAWVTKTDSTGNMEWNAILGGGEYDQANFVVENRDSDWVFAGETTSYGAGRSDAWLVKIAPLAANEFPYWIILVLLLFAVLLAVVVIVKKRQSSPTGTLNKP